MSVDEELVLASLAGKFGVALRVKSGVFRLGLSVYLHTNLGGRPLQERLVDFLRRYMNQSY